jgi:hypothetical protein
VELLLRRSQASIPSLPDRTCLDGLWLEQTDPVRLELAFEVIDGP